MWQPDLSQPDAEPNVFAADRGVEACWGGWWVAQPAGGNAGCWHAERDASTHLHRGNVDASYASYSGPRDGASVTAWGGAHAASPAARRKWHAAGVGTGPADRETCAPERSGELPGVANKPSARSRIDRVGD